MNQLTLEEKARLLTGLGPWHTYHCNRKIPSLLMTDGPHGLRKQINDEPGQNNESNIATCYPTASAIACSWDCNSVGTLATAIAVEAINERIGLVLGPGINIKRSPLCGRNFEYFSEDPYLSGCLGTAYVNAMQQTGVGSCLKHLAGNNQETRRQTSNSVIDERALREIYLSAFEMVIKNAKPMAVMSSYNHLNGEYSSQSKTLLTTILRNEWGYDGTVISDWGACTNLTKCVNAGMDLEMPDSNGCHILKFLDDIHNGNVDQTRFNEAVSHVSSLAERQEHMLSVNPQKKTDFTLNHKIAKQLECDSAVLLKNNGLLPLKKEAEILIIGDLAEHMRFQGGGSSHINTHKTKNAIQALKDAGMQIQYYQGYHRESNQPDWKLEKATLEALNPDIPVLFFGGLPDAFEGEGYDRKTLSIPDNQIHLLKQIYEINKNIIFISFSGSAIDFSFESMTGAILQMYLGGQAVGEACADLLTGVVNPNGKLAETFPMKLSDTPCYSYFAPDSDNVEYRESIFTGYRYYDTYQIPVRYPFGYGLSYTTFSYSNMAADFSIYESGKLGINLTITNTGHCRGKEIVQIYVKNPTSNYLRANRELRGFTKVDLNPGESKRITIFLDERSFSIYDVEQNAFIIPSGTYEIQACASLNDIRQHISVEVRGTTYKRDDRECLSEYFHQDIVESNENSTPDKLGRGMRISREQFETLYGRPIPDFDLVKRGEYTTEHSLNTLAKKSLLGKIVKFAAKQIVYHMFKDKSHDDPVVQMFLNGALDGTIDSTICQSGGAVPYKVAEAIVLSANGHPFKSIKKLLSD